MLKSFVSDEDYPKLVEIVKKIRDGVFNDVSILEIYGGYASGKSTFLQFLKKLGGRSIMIDSRIGDKNYFTSPHDLSAFKKSITIGELYDDNADTLTKYHFMINKPLTFRVLYSMDFQVIDRPATLIVATNIRQEIPIDGWEKRLPLYLHFPNQFDCKIPYDEIIKLCLDETKTL